MLIEDHPPKPQAGVGLDLGATRDGFDAGKSGLGRDDCPFPADDASRLRLRFCWLVGFNSWLVVSGGRAIANFNAEAGQ